VSTYLGEILSLTTALFWALTSIFFTFAGHRVGSRIVNRVRLLFAVPLLMVAHLIAEGTLLPVRAGLERWSWLGVSAIIGLVLGDGLLFYAFTQIGARLSMLLMALTPVIGTLLAWLFLGEVLSREELLAIVVTIIGIAWVVLERNRPPAAPAASPEVTPTPATPEARNYLIGVLAGIGAATGQATGLVLSKQGMVGDFPAISASLMRVVVATLVIWLGAAVGRQARSSVSSLRDRRALVLILGGAVVGPVLGMTLSLASVQLSEVGIASTLMAMSPVLLLPLAHWIFGERITLRAILGTVVAMAGVAMIFLL
jgi:drug/metabolite transporter (DMT)-like permease